MKSLRYSKISKGTQVIKQGDQMNRNIYILLSGLVIEVKKNQNVFSENITRTGVREQFEIKQFANSVSKRSNDNKEGFVEGDEIVKMLTEFGPDFNEVNIGEASGEDVLYEKGPRTCSMFTITDAEFITFDKNSFWKIQTFNNLQKKKIKKFQKDDFVFEEGQINEKVYIIQGSCEITMKYIIKKNFQKSISKDLKGTFVVENLANGFFFVGDEIVFESWKKYKYSVKISARNTFVYQCNLKDIEQNYDQATLNHMKEAYLKKMVMYKRKYDQKIQDVIQDNKKKIDVEKNSIHSSLSRNYNNNANGENQLPSEISKKQKKDFLSSGTQKGEQMSITQFLKQDGRQKGTFKEILQQVQRDKLQTRILEQNTINKNCCFQMRQPVYYVYSRSLSLNNEQSYISQHQSSHSNLLSYINQTMPLQEQPNPENNYDIFQKQNSLGYQISSNFEAASQLGQEEEWFPQQNDKLYLKKVRQKSVKINPDGSSFKIMESPSTSVQDPISNKSAFYSNGTESFMLSQSKLFITGGETSNNHKNKSMNIQFSFQECPSEQEGTQIGQELSGFDGQQQKKQHNEANEQISIDFSSQLQLYKHKVEKVISRTLPNSRGKKNCVDLQPVLSPIQKFELNDFSTLMKSDKCSSDANNYGNVPCLQSNSNKNDSLYYLKSIQNKNRPSTSAVYGSSSSNYQSQQQQSSNVLDNPYSFSPNESMQFQHLMKKKQTHFKLSNSFSFENKNNITQSLSNKTKISDFYIFQSPTEKKEKIKKGLVLSRLSKDDYTNHIIDESGKSNGFISVKTKRIHDISPDSCDKKQQIKIKRGQHFLRQFSQIYNK